MTERARLPYMPALDGLRGLAVAVVFLYHAGHLRGGFLGVSVFFTLSGFLITSLLMLEHRSAGRIDLVAFWGRRARRLLPAAYATILGICVWLGWFADDYPFDTLAGDVAAALLYVSNWRFILQDLDYSQALVPSFFTHFWSLAIEEQFYVVFPLLFPALVRLARGRRQVLAGLMGLLVLGSLAVTFLVDDGRAGGMVYLNTFTRAGEILVGAVLAVLALGWRSSPGSRRALDAAGLVALGAVVVASTRVTLADDALRVGGLLGFSLLSATVVAAVAHAEGVTARLLSFAPLRWLGLVSYGVYLVHYPVIRILTPTRTGLDPGWGLTAVQSGVTLAIAVVSYRLLELPVRHRRRFRRPRAALAVPAFGVVLFLLAWGVAEQARVPAPVEATPAIETARDEHGTVPTSTTQPAGEAPVRTLPIRSCDLFDYGAGDPLPGHTLVADPGTDLPKVMVVGDSVSCTAANGIQRRAEADGSMTVLNQATLGCGLFREGTVRRALDEGPISELCDWTRRWPEQVAAFDPDVVVVLTGAWDVADRRLPGSDEWVAPGDPTYAAALREEAERAHRLLTADGATVVWLSGPRIELGQLDGQPPVVSAPSSDPDRMIRHNEIVEAAVAGEPDVDWVDLFGWLEGRPGGATAADRRPDGVHFSEVGADELADWLNPQLEVVAAAAAADDASDPPPSTTTTPVTVDLTIAGDSLSVALAPPLRAGLESPDVTTSHLGFAGFLFYEPGRAWEDALGAGRHDVVVLFFSTWENIGLRSNTTIDTSRPGWQDEYRRSHVEPFLDDARRLAGDVVWVGMPTIRDPTVAAQQQELNAIWAAAAAGEPTVTWIDGATVLGGTYVEVDRTVEPPVRLFATDGLHLCPGGAERLAAAVFDAVEGLRGVRPHEGWAAGPWRLDPEAFLWGGCPDLVPA